METTAADLMRNMKKIHIALEAHLNARMAGEDLTAAQANVLFFILAHAGVHSTCIHQQLGISRGTVSGLIKKLREKGFLTLRTAPEDERQKLIEPTDRALELKQTLDRLAARCRRCDPRIKESDKRILKAAEKAVFLLSHGI